MAIVEQTSAGGTVASDGRQSWIRTNWGLLLAVGVLVVILLLPTPAGLPVAGHRMLAILAFAVIVWMTEALDYAVSAIVIAALMAFLLGLAPERRPIRRCCWAPAPALDARLQRLRQHRAGAGRRGAVPRRRHDRDRPRQAHRAHHPVARRHRNPPRRHRHHPGRLRDRVHGAVDHRARRLPGADHARHHRRLRRQQDAAPSPAC